MESGQARSVFYGAAAGDFRAELQQFGNDGFHAGLMLAVAEEAGSSFTALLELPAEQAVELLVHSSETEASPPANLPEIESRRNYRHGFLPPPIFPSDAALIDRASKLSVFAGNSPSNSCSMTQFLKQEPVYADPNPKSSSPDVSNPTVYQKSTKREREKKIKEPCMKKSKKATKSTTAEEGGEKLPYVHVRARRGQATDSHSLAERARREKINARMKLLQELVPGCNKISGTAMVLDEIINHVQFLQRQVEATHCYVQGIVYPNKAHAIFKNVEGKMETRSWKFFVVEFLEDNPLDLPHEVLRSSLAHTPFSKTSLVGTTFKEMNDDHFIDHDELHNPLLFKSVGFYYLDEDATVPGTRGRGPSCRKKRRDTQKIHP
ncbi:unnamed protein product [Cuscuta campestris]|uniref:BHLH domain-containing protein n=1 Tax=Cuscuta campestris TaxID=132261 RepID=A0A484LC45_9ASTE|nr:unnamed protein product [Cuscuta campestris]